VNHPFHSGSPAGKIAGQPALTQIVKEQPPTPTSKTLSHFFHDASRPQPAAIRTIPSVAQNSFLDRLAAGFSLDFKSLDLTISQR
jgi:hypothetical protein